MSCKDKTQLKAWASIQPLHYPKYRLQVQSWPYRCGFNGSIVSDLEIGNRSFSCSHFQRSSIVQCEEPAATCNPSDSPWSISLFGWPLCVNAEGLLSEEPEYCISYLISITSKTTVPLLGFLGWFPPQRNNDGPSFRYGEINERTAPATSCLS